MPKRAYREIIDRNDKPKSSAKRKRTEILDDMDISKYVGAITRSMRRKLENAQKLEKKLGKTDYTETEHQIKRVSVILRRLTKTDLEKAGVYVSKPTTVNKTSDKENATASASTPASINIERNNDERAIVKRLTKSDLEKAEVDVWKPTTQNKTFDRENATASASTSASINIERIEDERAIAKPDFSSNEIIWGKMKGSTYWPAKIVKILTTVRGTIMYEIVWYNDYRKSKIYKTQAYKFLINFEKFAIKFDDVIGLKAAAFEAMHEYRKKFM